MLLRRQAGWSTVSELLYWTLVLLVACLVALSSIFLTGQAIRTSPRRTIAGNFNTIVIGACYVAVLVASLFFCVKRSASVHRRLQRISKGHRALGRGDVPRSVHYFIAQEYARACLVAYESEPKDGFQPGWGRPGTRYDGIYFRRDLLDTVQEIDELARLLIPKLPPLKPTSRILHHLRYIEQIFPPDESGLRCLHHYDAVIQLAKYSTDEPTEEEFEQGMTAAVEMKRILFEYHQAIIEASSTDLSEGNESAF
ncbi:hypothetical protein PUNSTDRAFT_129232 [Punctularia strigosozonata HHB-11173 SS5]|uniref:uncharacterized protein n=1 Tax=Punctularia strigosozonata (strain HHB-11173) TaxID=741275 RepID=UPI0004416735|nr:uncharacterized protein PUNSTDRAFT_129232 [Punctularia strigosozonata HHB-11173 SS5]EIN13552.1 hypothetical protein PUNSTDRAFT_129232 [Punctularia strigosozonata HHB-11173 SS5]